MISRKYFYRISEISNLTFYSNTFLQEVIYMSGVNLKGWDYIVYVLIQNNFKGESFFLSDLYAFEPYFKTVYPNNLHIKDKLRQILQHLRDKSLLAFEGEGKYKFTLSSKKAESKPSTGREVVYLLSNESISGWIKIGRTKSIEKRLKQLYCSSVPLPFKVEELIETHSLEKSRILEKSIHNIIDTINPDLRKNTEANRREFFKMTADQGKMIFELVSRIMGINETTYS